MTPRVRLLARLSFAQLRHHTTRSLLMLGGIAIGVAAFVAVSALNRSIESTFKETVARAAGEAQLQVSNGSAGLERSLVEEIAQIPGVGSAVAHVQYNLALPDAGRRLLLFGSILGEDEPDRAAGLSADAVDIPNAFEFLAHGDSVALSTSILAERSWKVGDTITVAGSQGRRSLTVRGRVRPEGVLRMFGGDVAFMDLDAAQQAFGDPDLVHWVDVVVQPGHSVDGVRTELQRFIAGRGVVDSPAGRGRRIEAMLSLLRALLTLTGVIAMLVGVFLIHHAVSTSLLQRRSDLVRLKAFGLSRAMLVAYLLAEAAVLGLLASAVGLAVGVGFWFLAAGDFAQTVSSLFVPLPPPRFALSGGEIATALSLGVLSSLAGALTPSVSALRLRPLEVKQQDGQGADGRRLAAYGIGVAAAGPALVLLAPIGTLPRQTIVTACLAACLFVGTTLLFPLVLDLVAPAWGRALGSRWSLLGRWTWQQVRRRRMHTATTMGALAAGVAFAVGITVILASYREAFRAWFNQTIAASDLVVSRGLNHGLLSGPTIDPGLEAELVGVKGVARVMPWRFLEVQFRGQPIMVQAVSETLLKRIYPTFDPDAVFISDVLSERFGLGVGDVLDLPAPVAPLSVRVAAVVPDYVLHLGCVKLGWETFTRHFGRTGVTLFAVDVADGADLRDVKARIERLGVNGGDLSVFTAVEMREVVDHLIDQSVALTYWLQLLGALVAIAAMVNASAASIVDRVAELRLWRAVGLPRKQLVSLLTLEAGVVGAIGSAAGLLAGVVLGYPLVTVITRAVAGFRLQISWPIAAAALLFVSSTLAAAGAAYVVARGWTRRDAPVEPAPT